MGTYFIVRVITGFGNVIITLICLQAIMSWFVSAMPPGVIRFYNLLASLTEPFVRPFSEAYREICVFHGNRLFASDRYYRDSVDLQIDRSADSVYLVHQKRFFEKSINQDGPEAARPFACIYEHKGAS